MRRRLPRSAAALLALVLAPALAAAAAAQGEPHGLIGDFVVEIDGQPAPRAEVFESKRARALVLIAPAFSSPVRLDVATRQVELLDLMAVGRPSPAVAEVFPRPPLAAEGAFTLDGDRVVFRVGGHAVRLSPRPYLLGSRSAAQVVEHDPTYGVKAKAYTPISDVVDRLRKARGDVKVLVYFGSWCPHCKDHVPLVLGVAQRLAGGPIDFEFHGLPSGFGNDAEAAKWGIRAVPTGIVLVDGKEAGRLAANQWKSPEAAIYEILKKAGAV